MLLHFGNFLYVKKLLNSMTHTFDQIISRACLSVFLCVTTAASADFTDLTLTDVVNTAVSIQAGLGTRVEKTSVAMGFDADAVSTSLMQADGEVRFQFGTSNQNAFLGLTSSNDSRSYADLEYSIYGISTGKLFVWESGINRGEFGTYTSTDVLSIQRVGSQIMYKKNGVVFYSSTVSSSGSLMLDCSLFSQGTVVEYIRGDGFASFTDLSFTDAVNVSATVQVGLGGRLEKTSAAIGFDADAVSTSLMQGDGELRFKFANSGQYAFIGLNESNDNSGFSDLDFSIYGLSNGKILVWESGVNRGEYSNYTTADVFSIERIGTQIMYKKNGTVFYTSTVSSAAPLMADFSLFAQGTVVEHIQGAGFTESSLYLKTVSLPNCDGSNSSVQFINSDADWSQINNSAKTIFCVSPGDYSALGKINITTSGSSAEPRYIILNNGNNLHPAKLAFSELAKYRLEFNNADYWVVDRIANWEDVNPLNTLITVNASSHNILNRAFTQDTSSSAVVLNTGSHENTIQNFHLEKTQWSVDYAVANLPASGLPPYTSRIFADLAAIAFSGLNPGDEMKNNVVVHNEIINYVDAFQTVRNGNASLPASEPNPLLNGEGTVVADNLFYITPLLYTDGAGNFTITGDKAVAENALDFKFGSLNPSNPIIITGNYMFGYRFVDNTYSALSDTGNAMVFHFGAGNIKVINNYIFDSNNGMSVGGSRGSDPGLYDTTMVGNLFYDLKEDASRFFGTLGVNSYDATANVILESNVFGKVGIDSIQAYNTDSLTIRNNDFVDSQAMYFAPLHDIFESRDLTIMDNSFYNTSEMGLPFFATTNGNIHVTTVFDWSPYDQNVLIRIFTDAPELKTIINE